MRKLSSTGRNCLTHAQETLQLIVEEKVHLLDRMQREQIFRTRARLGLSQLTTAEQAVVLHVSYQPDTGKRWAYTPVDFGMAHLTETNAIYQSRIKPVFSSSSMLSTLLVSLSIVMSNYSTFCQ